MYYNITTTMQQQRVKQPNVDIYEDIFQPSLLTKRITIDITLVDNYIQNTLLGILKKEMEGKCCVVGYIKPDSIKILTYSSGIIIGSSIGFDVNYECMVCFPVDGMILKVKAVSINTAGIKSESITSSTSPYVLFISRNHHQDDELFNSIQIGDSFFAKVIGQRFELNDKYISLIGEIINQ